MIGTELLKGQGLGNQLFVYVTARAIALERGCEFGICNPAALAKNIHSDTGNYFLDIDLGHEITQEEKKNYTVFDDDETRLYNGSSWHDIHHGAYISGARECIHEVADNTLLYGNLQAESYFVAYRDELRNWLKVRPEYDTHEYTRENLCVIHLRHGDYSDHPELLLRRSYWKHGIENMKRIRPDMEFVIVTEDTAYAKKVFPGIPAISNDIGTDYAILKNATYLLLGNSSFAVFPAFTNENLKYAIAPKYWARHNGSDGYWASEQNIYSIFHYQDRAGNLFTPEECRRELEAYKRTSPRYRMRNMKPTGARKLFYTIESRLRYAAFRADVYAQGILRRLHLKMGVITG